MGISPPQYLFQWGISWVTKNGFSQKLYVFYEKMFPLIKVKISLNQFLGKIRFTISIILKIYLDERSSNEVDNDDTNEEGFQEPSEESGGRDTAGEQGQVYTSTDDIVLTLRSVQV